MTVFRLYGRYDLTCGMKNISMNRTLILLTGILLCLWAPRLQAATLRQQMQWLHEHYGVNFIYDSSLVLDVTYEGRPLAEISAETEEDALKRCLDALFEGSGIKWTINRKYVVLTKGGKKPKDYAIFLEEQCDTLQEARITALLDGRRNATQTGLTKIDGTRFRRSFSALSSPDLIKTLQTLPGVRSGTELIGGLYVHGGTGQDNLFLMDGIPFYETCHLAGLFSAFNTESVDRVDFFKSGFPARYGGRLSSVVDVSIKDGSMDTCKGSFGVGLINGSFQLEGPLVKDRTSFNVALRRSWLDVLTIPGLALYNKLNDENDFDLDLKYAMSDLTAKVTHRFAKDNYLRFSLYAGRDVINYGMMYGKGISHPEWYSDTEEYSLKWGSLLAALSWDKVLGNGTASDISLYYTRYRSHMAWDRIREDVYDKEEDFLSYVHGIGVKADFDSQLTSVHRLRYGADARLNIFTPSCSWDYTQKDGLSYIDHKAADYIGSEISLYAEDEMTLNEWLSVNAGLRAVLFGVRGKVYARVEPRAAVYMKASEKVSFKVSYAEMNQFSHRLVTTYMSLPSAIWMPSTAEIPPMNSRQVEAGAYFALLSGLSLEVEGFYKTLDHIREYKGMFLFPGIEGWEKDFVPGKGRAYGLEAGLEYNAHKTSAALHYTLSSSERFFRKLYPEWFPDRFDNRHRLNLSVSHRFSKRLEMYGGWTYHAGDRVTVESQFYHEADKYIFTSPNNIRLPDYHRLDVGFNFHRTTRRGNEAIWNLSIYNLYCRMNPLFVYPEHDGDVLSYKVMGVVPLLPTFSYTLRF